MNKSYSNSSMKKATKKSPMKKVAMKKNLTVVKPMSMSMRTSKMMAPKLSMSKGKKKM